MTDSKKEDVSGTLINDTSWIESKSSL
jgi:hypothetical protein